MRSVYLKTLFAILVSVFSMSGIAQAKKQYPIPTEVQDFYKNLNTNYKTNCADTLLMDDIVTGPNLFLGFYKNGNGVLPSGQEVYFSSLKLYGKTFPTTYKISSKNGFEVLDMVTYEDACVPRYPFGDGCRPAGVWRYLIQIVKDARTGWVTSARMNRARNGQTLFGNLKGRWSDRGLYQYNCKDGVLTVSINK